eukprot:5055045-Prymnesium_polylepis.3
MQARTAPAADTGYCAQANGHTRAVLAGRVTHHGKYVHVALFAPSHALAQCTNTALYDFSYSGRLRSISPLASRVSLSVSALACCSCCSESGTYSTARYQTSRDVAIG